MSWNLEEAVSYYKGLGAPRDQNALIGLLREVQAEHGGSIPGFLLADIASAYQIRESLLQALIRRIPSLHLGGSHCLELCAGPNCGKHAALSACAEALQKDSAGQFTLKYVPCMRMCGKGPNIRWDGKVYNGAPEEVLRKLVNDTK